MDNATKIISPEFVRKEMNEKTYLVFQKASPIILLSSGAAHRLGLKSMERNFLEIQETEGYLFIEKCEESGTSWPIAEYKPGSFRIVSRLLWSYLRKRLDLNAETKERCLLEEFRPGTLRILKKEVPRE
jgi:hypothetical protein